MRVGSRLDIIMEKEKTCNLCTAADVALYGGFPRRPVMEVQYTWRRRGARKFAPLVQTMCLCYGCALQYGLIDLSPGNILHLGFGEMRIIDSVVAAPQPRQVAAPPASLNKITVIMEEEMTDELYGRW